MSPSNPGNPPLGAQGPDQPTFPYFPGRGAPFQHEPGFHEPGSVWLYGNAHLLRGSLAHIPLTIGCLHPSPREIDEIERQAEQLVLSGSILVCGIHNPIHQLAALVPLRWGAPRIVVFSGGFYRHLGPDLTEEPFAAARLWRLKWDCRTDLAVSRASPDKSPAYAHDNPAVDQLIVAIATESLPGFEDACVPPHGRIPR